MFNLFKKKLEGSDTIDICFISEEAKIAALISLAKSDPACRFVCWFIETKDLLADRFVKEGINQSLVRLAEKEGRFITSGEQIIMVEHHPNKQLEQNFFKQINASEVKVYNSLSEPIFRMANVESIIELLRKMGIQDDEPIQHSSISNSIKKMQEKFDSPFSNLIHATSQEEWIRKNSINS